MHYRQFQEDTTMAVIENKIMQQYENFWGEMANRSFDVTRRFLMKL